MTGAAPALPTGMSDVVHVPEKHRFELALDGEVAVLSYEQGDGDVTLLHTVVPRPMEGQGVGGRLAAAAVGWARDRDLEVVPVCSFVRSWLDRHPDALR